MFPISLDESGVGRITIQPEGARIEIAYTSPAGVEGGTAVLVREGTEFLRDLTNVTRQDGHLSVRLSVDEVCTIEIQAPVGPSDQTNYYVLRTTEPSPSQLPAERVLANEPFARPYPDLLEARVQYPAGVECWISVYDETGRLVREDPRPYLATAGTHARTQFPELSHD